MIRFLVIFIATVNSLFLSSQDCDFTVSVPQDITLCEPGTVVLDGDISGTYFSFEWSGTNGFLETGNLTPSVWVDQNTTFTLRAFSFPTNNLIFNGDFSQGNTGFTTQYNYMQDVPGYQMELWNEGTYSVHTNPNDLHLNFAACPDQSGDGNMMILNGGGSFQQIWCQTVTVDPNTTYIFSAWGTSVISSSPAQLQFSINSNLIGTPLTLSPSTCAWQEFFTTWDSGGNTTAEICVVNNNTQPSGNDFAIDNIFFGPLCEEEESFTVTMETFEIIEVVPELINCLNFSTDITAIVLPDLGFDYEWSTTDGAIGSPENEQTITVLAPGYYTVTVTSSNGCTQEMTYFVDSDLTPPDVFISGDNELDCSRTSTLLTAGTSFNYTDIMWEWPNGFTENSAVIEANVPGTYMVTVTGTNGCTGTGEVEVVRNIPDLEYNIWPPDSLTCSRDTVTIGVEVVNMTDSISWRGPDIIGWSPNKDSVTVGTLGVYYFTLHLGLDCSITDSIRVDSIPAMFEYHVSVTDTLDCRSPELDVYLNDTRNIEQIFWHHNGAQVFDTLKVFSAGTYYFTVMDANGCSQLDSVEVAEDFALPEYTVRIDSIDCVDNFGRFFIAGADSSEVRWEGEGFSSNERNPLIYQDGQYTLTVTGTNGCTAISEVIMPNNRDYPVLTSELTPINCQNPVGIIEADVNLSSVIQWTGPQGQSGTGFVIAAEVSGDYVITATTPEGCKDTLIVTMEADTLAPVLMVSVDSVLNCSVLSVSPDVQAQGFTRSQWSGPDGFESGELEPVFSGPGLYTLLLLNENNGCQTEASIVMTQDTEKPGLSVYVDNLSCDQPSTFLFIDEESGVSYFINDNQIYIDSFLVSEPGVYTIQATAANGCDSIIHVQVDGFFEAHMANLPVLELNCYQSEQWIRDNEFSEDVIYFWSKDGEEIMSDSVLVGRNEAIILRTVNSYGCESVQPVVVNEDFTLPEVGITGDSVISCRETFSELTGTTPLTENVYYVWRDSDGKVSSQFILEANQPGFYTWIVTNLINGCQNQTGRNITLQESPQSLDYQVTQPLCFGDKGLFEWLSVSGGTSPYTLTLGTNDVNINQRTELNPGNYDIVVYDSNGCELRNELTIEEPDDFSVDAGNHLEVNYGDKGYLMGSTTLPVQEWGSIEWIPADDLSCTDCLNPVTSTLQDREYELILTDLNGCLHSDHVQVRVKINKGHVAPNIIYPESPAGNSRFTVFGLFESVRMIQSLDIYDRWGNQVFTARDIVPGQPDLGWNGRQNGQDVSPGVFVWVAEILYVDGTTEIVSGDVTVIR